MKKKFREAEFITIFQSGQLWEIDMARDTLKQAEIPHIVREETLSGVIASFQATPAPGIGITWCILVPKFLFEKSKVILQQLPFDIDKKPGYLDFNSDPRLIKSLKILMWISLIIIGIGFIYCVLNIFI